MRKIFALLLLVFASPAFGQNHTCPTAPNGDSSNKCASTQFVQNATTALLPDTLTQYHLFVGNASGIAADTALSGDCTYGASGIVCTKTNGTAFGTFATQNYATPPAIGGTTPNTGAFSSLTVNSIGINPSSAATNDVLSYNGSSFVHSAILTVLNAVCTAAPSSCASFFGYYNIAWYGAVSGADTGSRNSTALTNALSACSTNGGRVFIPAGNFQYATAQQQTGSNCGVFGGGNGSSIVTYTGTGTGWTVGPNSGANISNVRYSSFQIACSAACVNALLVQDVSESIVFDNMDLNGGSGGGQHAVQITSLTTTSGGSFDVYFTNGTVIQNCTAACAYINPLSGTAALVQAVYFDHVFWNGYNSNALYGSGGSGWFVTNSHIERHLGATVTTPAFHFDTTNKVDVSHNYFEDEANAPQVELGTLVNNADISHNYVSVNGLGGSHSNATFVKYNGLGTPPGNITISDDYVIVSGTVGNVIDLGAVTKAWLNNVFLNVGTATTGVATTSTTAQVHVGGLTTAGTVTTPSSVAVPTSCSAGISATTGTTDGYGAITHC